MSKLTLAPCCGGWSAPCRARCTAGQGGFLRTSTRLPLYLPLSLCVSVCPITLKVSHAPNSGRVLVFNDPPARWWRKGLVVVAHHVIDNKIRIWNPRPLSYVKERERGSAASACIKRHQVFALVPVRERESDKERETLLRVEGGTMLSPWAPWLLT